jgi:Flp pilus assembly protein TadG
MATTSVLIRRMRDFARETRGNVMMLFALSCLVIFPLVGFAIDFSRVIVDKQKLQMTTDSAALAAAHDVFESVETRQEIVEAYLTALSQELGREVLYTFSQSSDGTITLVTRISVETTISKIMGRDEIDVRVRSDAVAGGSDIEVAIVLDVSGSMSGSRIAALKDASAELIDIVVSEEQVPYYSKASIIPYASAVNPGTYLEAARGSPVPGRSITAAAWRADNVTRNISGATRANPVTITSNGHGYSNGDIVWISGVSGMTQINNQAFTVASATTNTFRLSGVNGTSYSNYTSGGQIRECLTASCRVRVTANNHDLDNDDRVYITGVNGMTQINTSGHNTWQVTDVTSNTYILVNSVGPNYGTYTSGGTSWCTRYGCEYFRHINDNNSQRVYRETNCVTERTGEPAFTDQSASSEKVSFHYPNSSGNCPGTASTIVPLTADKEELTSHIEDLVLANGTAGHIGAEWGWFTLSPEFGQMFPAESRPADYNRERMQKFAVIMTDGEFNAAYCNGVLAKNSTLDSKNERINCNAHNGTSFVQFAETCSNMRDNGIRIYTVGFYVGTSTTVRNALINCASSPQNAYFAEGAEELTQAFQQIGNSINEVRLVR